MNYMRVLMMSNNNNTTTEEEEEEEEDGVVFMHNTNSTHRMSYEQKNVQQQLLTH